jgi:hypothetical protein
LAPEYLRIFEREDKRNIKEQRGRERTETTENNSDEVREELLIRYNTQN